MEKKFYNLLFGIAIFALILNLGQFIFAETIITGTVEDYIVVTINPETIDFENIPYGTNITHPGTDITINTTGSETSSGEINIEISIEGTDEAFFTPLLEFDESENPEVINWVKVASMGAITMQKDSIKIYHTQLNGDTTGQGLGTKSAIIVYTTTSEISSNSKATRTFSSASVTPGEIVDVELNISVLDGATYYAIEEYIPTGWVVVDDGSGATPVQNKLGWVVTENAIDTIYHYSVQAPMQPRSYSFNGIYQFENSASYKSTSGESVIIVG